MKDLLHDIVLTDDLKTVIKIARALAKENIHAEFAPAQLLKALLHEEAALLPLLEKLGKDVYYLEEWAEVRMETIQKSSFFPDTITGDGMIAEVINEADSIRVKLLKDAIE